MPYPTKLTPDAIVEAAWQLFQTGGPAALSMRPLADALGVRPGSLYRHFASREVLLRALAERAARDLNREITTAADGHLPRNALQAVAGAYLHYARTQPHAYALLLVPDDDTATPGLMTSAGKDLWNALLRVVGDLSGDPDDTDHAVALWTFLHGAASLERAGVYGHTGPRGGVAVGLRALLDHMAEGGRGTVPPER